MARSLCPGMAVAPLLVHALPSSYRASTMSHSPEASFPGPLEEKGPPGLPGQQGPQAQEGTTKHCSPLVKEAF